MAVAEVAVAAPATFKPVKYTCPKSPDFQFVIREPGNRRDEEQYFTRMCHFTNGGFIATDELERQTVERLRTMGGFTAPTIYREAGPDQPLICPRCTFRTGIPDAFNEHIALCADKRIV